jgi:hypothetical protein
VELDLPLILLAINPAGRKYLPIKLRLLNRLFSKTLKKSISRQYADAPVNDQFWLFSKVILNFTIIKMTLFLSTHKTGLYNRPEKIYWRTVS